MKKKGVSPIIATVLLIALVIIIGLIVFFWMRGMIGEAVTKFNGENIDMVCERVSFDASYSNDDVISISNVGDVPIYSFNVKIEGKGNHKTQKIDELSSDWDITKGFNSGATFSGELSGVGNPEKITLIPILMGLNKKGEKKIVACNKRYGNEVSI